MEAYISMITAFGCNFTIRNWGSCSGGLIAISQNTALFSLIGTAFGGDGRTTFALPDLQGRSPVGEGQGPGLSPIRLGEKGGREDVALTQLNLPAHNHAVSLTGQAGPATGSLKVSADAANTGDPDGNYLGTGSGPIKPYAPTLSSPAGQQLGVVDVPAQQVQVSGQTNNAGSSQPFNIRNPYQALNYQICMYGLYPSRS